MNFLNFIFFVCVVSQNIVFAMTPSFNLQMKKSYSYGYLDDPSYGSFDYTNIPLCCNPELRPSVRTISAEVPEFIPQATLIVPVIEALNPQEVVVVESNQSYCETYDMTSIMFAYRRHHRFMPYRQSTHCIELETKCAVTSALCILSIVCIATCH